jgi:hypothetical protein
VTATVILILYGQPLAALIVDGLRGLTGVAATAGEWIEANRVVFVAATAAAGAVLALTFAVLVEARRGAAAILFGGGVLGFFAGESVLGWMRGSASDGPVMLVLTAGIAVFWAVASARSAARMKRLWASEARARAIMFDDRSRIRLPAVQIEPHGLPGRHRSADGRALAARASYAASFRSRQAHAEADPRQRRATTPPTG